MVNFDLPTAEISWRV